MELLNTDQILDKTLVVNRRAPTNGVIDTTQEIEERLNEFSNLMKVINNNKLPYFLQGGIPFDFHIENKLESIRISKYPNFPSRLSCTFLSEQYIFPTYKHKVKILEGSKIVRCDMNIISYIRSNPNYFCNEALFEGYWEGKTFTQIMHIYGDPSVSWEYLVEGKVELIYLEK